ncbi:MAG: hypothetical protein GX628_06580 [Clostridiales bacterium]|nr:hypothetical protein [Clostridiales bacterium]
MYTADSSKVMRPWTPVKASESDGAFKIDVWGREFAFDGSLFPSSLTSQGRELLAGAIRVTVCENGEEKTVTAARSFLMDDVTEETATVVCSADTLNFIFNTSFRVEYDGCVFASLAVMSRGQSILDSLGYTKDPELHFNLTGLTLEIPLKPEAVRYYSVWPFVSYLADGAEKKGVLESAGFLPDKLELPFCNQLYLGNDETGFAFFAEDSANWEYEGRPVEVVRRENEVVLRLRLLDREPSSWAGYAESLGRSLDPITFTFGFITTPVKPLPEQPYRERALHIDCAKKVLVDYDKFLFSEFEDTGEMTFDRIERLGINTLYIHELWNDIQNSQYLTRNTARRLEKIVTEAHRRGIKVIPYFGYEISTLSPLWSEIGEEVRFKATSPHAWKWYRLPAQRAPRLCYNAEEARDIFVDGIRRLIERFHFDGVYLDSTLTPKFCANEAHGCGTRDAKGELHPTCGMLAIRDMMKRLYAVIDPMGGIINCHTNMCINFSAMSFYHSIWDGEIFQMPLWRGEITKLPEGYYRAMLTGRAWGMPVQMLCYAKPPLWTMEEGISLCILFGTLPKSNDTGKPLELMSEIWTALDCVPWDKAKFRPFWQLEEGAVKSSCDTVKVSMWEYTDIMGRSCKLCFCANTVRSPAEAALELAGGITGFSSLCGVPAELDRGKVRLSFEGFGYSVFYTESEK